MDFFRNESVISMKRQLENEAIEALRQTLGQISVVKIRGIKVESHRHQGDKTIIAHVEIYGHAHRLICKLARNGDPLELQHTFTELRNLHAHFPGETIARSDCSFSHRGSADSLQGQQYRIS